MGVAHDQKGVRVHLLHRRLDGGDLPLLEGAHQHVLLLARIGPLAVEDGHPPVQPPENGLRDLLVPVADDIGHLRLVHAVQHPVHDNGGDIQRHQPVQGGFQRAEHRRHRQDHRQIDAHQQLAHGQPRQLQLQQAGQQVGAAGGGPLLKHQPQGQPHEHPAEDGGQHGVHGLPVVEGGEHVDEHRRDEHGVQRRHQQPPADELPPQQEQGDVQPDHRHADGQGGDQVVDDLGRAGDAAEGDAVGGVAPHEAQGVGGRAQGDHQKGDQGLFHSCHRAAFFLKGSGAGGRVTIGSSAPPPGPPP